MLPLEEPHFKINANTRAIEVPDDFKKNGIAVQGDDISEVVYFEIDRYFDSTDFNNCHIFIEWETPKNGNEPGMKSVSIPSIRDIESKPGKLIFDWIISDLITKNAGTIKFAVRFFEWEDANNKIDTTGERIFGKSFNTLVAQAVIKPSIGFNPTTDYANPDLYAGDRIIQRLKNGQVTGGVSASKPEYTINLIEDEYDLLENKKYTLQVQAYSADTGAISYSWRRQDIEKNSTNTVISGAISPIDGKNVYTKVDNNQLLTSYYVYYENIGTELEPDYIATPYNASNLPAGDNKDIVLYEKRNNIEVSDYGVYWAIAENRLSNSINQCESNYVVFPRPSAIMFTENGNLPLQGILNNDEPLVLTVNVSNDDGVLTYEWYYHPNKDYNFEYDRSEIESEDNGWKKVSETDFGSFIPPVDKEGHYIVKIINDRNNDKKQDFSQVSRITNKAIPSGITINGPSVFRQVELGGYNIPTIELDNENYDYYKITWNLIETIFNEETNEFEDVEIANIATTEDHYFSDGHIFYTFDPRDHIDTILEKSQGKDITGIYYPIVTKYYNDTEAISNSKEENAMPNIFFTISE